MGKEIQRVVEAVNTEHPKPADMQKFREFLKSDVDAWKVIGDLSETTRGHVLQSIKNAALTESTKYALRELEQQLGYDGATAIERLLIENILNCWIQYHLTEYRYTSQMSSSLSLKQGEYWEKKLTAAQRRYLRAIETLAKVRKMKLPAVQVNIGEKQLNIVR